MSPLLGRCRAAPGLREDEVRATWQVASLLLDHPEAGDPLDVVAEVLPTLPAVAAEPLGRFLARKGYPAHVIFRVLNELLPDGGEGAPAFDAD